MTINLHLKVSMLQTCAFLQVKVLSNIIQSKIVLYLHAFSMQLRHLTELVIGHCLYSKLIQRNIPLVIVRIVAFWYQIQPICALNGENLTRCI